MMGPIALLDCHERPRWAMRLLRRLRAIFGRCPCAVGKSNCCGGEFGPCPYCACALCNAAVPPAECKRGAA